MHRKKKHKEWNETIRKENYDFFAPLIKGKLTFPSHLFVAILKKKKSSFYLLSWVLATKSEALRVMFSEAHKVLKVMEFPDKQTYLCHIIFHIWR